MSTKRSYPLQVLALLSGGLVFAPSALAKEAGPAIKLVRKDADRRIDVLVDDKPFTAYIYPETEGKPSLFPMRSASGTIVTRGYPLDPRPGEATDHPHHTGLWFNYGEVNAGDVTKVDFWGNSEKYRRDKPDLAFGTIVHRSVKKATNGTGKGELQVSSDWVLPNGKTALKEETRFIFSAGDGRRAVDRVATLTAALPTSFPDNKEGALGLRVARSLEQPDKKKPNIEATGLYRSSEGKTGDDVWGTRARWVMLTGKVEGESVTIAMFDHPKNPGHPTYWHARGYGLFAANPFAQKVMSKGKEELNFSLKKGKKARFAYRVVILSRDAKAEDVEAEYKRYVAELR
jgi:hypothetical protein